MRKISFFLCFCACGALLPVLPPGTSYAQQAYGSVSAQSFTLQIMTLLDKYSADKELKKISKRGYSAYISEYTTETGKVLYKIRSGKYANRPSAVAAAKKFQANEGVAVMVVTVSDDAPAGKENSAHEAAEPDATEEKKNESEKGVRITVQDAEKNTRPTSLQEKVAALKRGEIPLQDKKTAPQEPNDGIWFTLQTSTEPDKQSAERRINQLGRKGYDAYFVEKPLNNGKMQFKIRIGKYASPDEAGQAAQRFNATERRGCMVVKIVPTGYFESEKADASDGQLQDGPDDIEEEAFPQAAKSRVQNTVSPDDAENMPASDMPSEPEPAHPATQHANMDSAPEATEQTDLTESDAEQMQAADAAAEKAAARRMTKIYAYRTESGAINLTNRYEDIPDAVRHHIEYISLFPVHITELANKGPRLTIEADGKKTEIVLAGFSMPIKSAPVRAYLEELTTKPLRLKYSPNQTTEDGAIAGRLYLKEGSYINLDMVRKGLGECRVQTLPADQQEAFRQAQAAAKRERVGIWAN